MKFGYLWHDDEGEIVGPFYFEFEHPKNAAVLIDTIATDESKHRFILWEVDTDAEDEANG